jgi:hypothetical protein
MRNQTQHNSRVTDESVSRALRTLPRRLPPADLRSSLLVTASRERQRFLSRQTWGQRWATAEGQFRLAVENFMRPMAIPFAGGVFSAVILFSMLFSSNYPVRASTTFDIPTMLTTAATVKGAAPVGAADGEIVVDISVDGQGKMVDYTIVSGNALLQNHTLRRNLENMLLFTEFVPATSFGKPTAARLRLSLHSLSHVDVKG